MENLKLGLLLMVVGMLTVFAILLVVIYGSRILVRLVNRIAPDEVKPAKRDDSQLKAVLDAAVAQLTGGKGRITKITEI